MTTLEKLKEILSECKGEDLDITPETTFDELEFDSLDKVDIVMQIEEAYDISLGDNMQLSTVFSKYNIRSFREAWRGSPMPLWRALFPMRAASASSPQ